MVKALFKLTKLRAWPQCVFYFNNKLFNKNKPQLKHIILKAIQCTLLSLCMLLDMLQVLPDFKHFNNC